jgi:leader peptidase (prepilin peptidase)/N-methyltransferase
MIQVLGTVFAALAGLAFGSFLNVCLSRWPQSESIVKPRSFCHDCGHVLAWWENVPLVSWLALRGRCRECRAWIGWRTLLVELAVGGLWALVAWRFFSLTMNASFPIGDVGAALADAVGKMIFLWMLVALAVLDAENLWLPDWITLPGIALGIFFRLLLALVAGSPRTWQGGVIFSIERELVAIVVAGGFLLLMRWLYWLIRRREGMGLGDVKLIAMLAAWLGLMQTVLAFCLGVVLGAVVAVVMLAVPTPKIDTEGWALKKLPLGTFLCVGGVVSALWGQRIVEAYLRLAGF